MVSKRSDQASEEMQYLVIHFVILVVFSAFATTIVGLRCWARKLRYQALRLSDYLTVLGLVTVLHKYQELSLTH